MRKDTVANRLDSMDRQVMKSLRIVAEKYKELQAGVDETEKTIEAGQEELANNLRLELDTAIADLHADLLPAMVWVRYLYLPWYRRLITRRPR